MEPEAERRAAVLFGVDQTEPALLGELGPELVGDAGGLFHPRLYEPGRALILEEFARGRAKELLLLAESEVHGASPWEGRATARR